MGNGQTLYCESEGYNETGRLDYRHQREWSDQTL